MVQPINDTVLQDLKQDVRSHLQHEVHVYNQRTPPPEHRLDLEAVKTRIEPHLRDNYNREALVAEVWAIGIYNRDIEPILWNG
jgi:hypothetical protein